MGALMNPLPLSDLPLHIECYHKTSMQSLFINFNHISFFDYCRLLVQLEETERNFDDFWGQHENRLQQCLQLRKFEEDFKQVGTLYTA